MSNLNTDKMARLMSAFMSIKGDDLKDKALVFLEQIATLSKENRHHTIIESRLDDSVLADATNHANIDYVKSFVKFINNARSEDIKRRIVDLMIDLNV